jgi:hypothetical protein
VGGKQPIDDRAATLDRRKEIGGVYLEVSGKIYTFDLYPTTHRKPYTGRDAQDLSLLQDPEMGGIADRPGDMVDVFHTVFGIAGLSLLKHPGLKEVDPI